MPDIPAVPGEGAAVADVRGLRFAADDTTRARDLATGYGLRVRSMRIAGGAVPFPWPSNGSRARGGRRPGGFWTLRGRRIRRRDPSGPMTG
ncbi:hypothetical protein [Streptomyces sp. JW3]|uniref:hypothetical protein n=1 Tax=Streptomyces sp. JW3 TaxID=3456955 RepID=UPI003FA48781